MEPPAGTYYRALSTNSTAATIGPVQKGTINWNINFDFQYFVIYPC